jgi:hypothetical protein
MDQEKGIFLRACQRIIAERAINRAEIIRRTGINRSSLYGFLAYGRGMEDSNMNRLAKYLGFDSWVDVVVAEQGGGKDEATDSGGGKVWIDSDYLENLKRRVDALQMLVEQHLKGHSDGPAGEAKKNMTG